MNILSADNISKQFGDRYLLKNVTLGVLKGQKIALVGSNGSGKTTLLNILTGSILPDEGKVATRKDVKIGFLSQNPQFDEKLSIADTIFTSENPQQKAIKAYEQALLHPEKPEALQKSLEMMDDLQAWDYEIKIKQILGKLDIHDLDKKISELSGGQKKRVALAYFLIDDPDLLILDEPTNHLDVETIEWLEYQLSMSEKSLLLVSHDRYFLDKVCNKIVELDFGQIYHYEGNYGYFLEKKAEREAIEQSEIQKAKNLFRKELEWIRKQPKARGTKAKYRIDNFYKIQEKAQSGKQEQNLQIDTKTSRLGNKILELKDVYKKYGVQKIAENLTYTFQKGEKIGIVGVNGVGKSTLLKMITGQIAPDQGTIELGETVKLGYYSQDELKYQEGQRVLDFIKEIAEVVTLGNGETITASQFLNRFLFSPEVQYKPIEKLSGGEKRRLQLMQVLIQNPNFLILDEPTNDLDIQTLNILEEFLENFQGCLLLVSHDRYFMDKLVEHLFILEGEGKIKDFNGNYSDYRNWLDEQTEQEKMQEKNKSEKIETKIEPTITASVSKRKLSFKEKQEFESLEKEIKQLEQKKAQLVEKLNVGEGSHEDLINWAKEIEQISSLLDEKEIRWLELSE
ncbi:ABC transporter [bacterium 336/3]|nr:ABC transporter [bacterium 336/3]